MQIPVILTLSVHVLSAFFWMGTTMSIGRSGGFGFDRLFRPQMGAAIVALLTGGYLWSLLHTGGFGTWEMCLTVGIGCAVIAAGIQGVGVGPVISKFKSGALAAPDAQKQAARLHGIAGLFLAVTLIAMVIGRYL